ncbi:hypothetical protein LINPERPRIM_LOCUS1646 [Linum perenne]
MTAAIPCSPKSPKNPDAYYHYVQNVLRDLVNRTPKSSMNMFKASHPNSKRGSVAGAATCYTTDPHACRSCLQGLKAEFDRCTRSVAGGSFASKCNMQFWEIGSI